MKLLNVTKTSPDLVNQINTPKRVKYIHIEYKNILNINVMIVLFSFCQIEISMKLMYIFISIAEL